MVRLVGILLLLGSLFLFPEAALAQKAKQEGAFKENHTPFGKRRKERKNQKGTAGKISRGGGFSLFKKRNRSAGNADAFASNSMRGGRGFMYKIFHPNSSSPRNASLRKTRPGKVQDREQKKLFHRIVTKNKSGHERIQSNKRKERSRKRKRGNEVFADRKR
jgi:hypothetical protein